MLDMGTSPDTVANEIIEFEVVELQPFSAVQMLFATQEHA